MTYRAKRSALLLPLMAPFLIAGCVSQSKYDALEQQNHQLQQHVSRLQAAINYTVNSDLVFPSGSSRMSADGAEIIAKMAKTLAADQQNKLLVNGYTDNAPIGPELRQQGITSNQMLSQKRAETVMNYMISQGINPELVAAQGFGEANPIALNDTAQGRAQNRRVEITLAPTTS